jgi:pseudouridine synthase
MASPSPNPDSTSERVRLQKFLAAAGVGSRRACEQLIEEGAVKVNGKRVTELPVLIDPETDRIVVRGKRIEAPDRLLYVMLYKPGNTVCTMSDPDGRRTVAELVQHPGADRLFPIGRLDYETLGLLLLTNDGPLANRLTHPRYEVHKKYRAIVKGTVTPDEIETLERGIFLALRKEGKTVGAARTGGASLRIVHRQPDKTILDVTLTEGRNREVRRMLAHFGHRVKKLTRIQLGPLRLKGLAVGEWRELSPGEVRALKAAAGLTRPPKGKAGGRTA